MAGLGRYDDRICASSELQEGGPGFRFAIQITGNERSAFVIRYHHVVYAYINACAHKATELDWQPGEFFDADRRYLICATHGALYEPTTGNCVAGPCRGRGLTALPVYESDGTVYLSALRDLQLAKDYHS